MNIRVKLMASLRDKLPPEAKGGSASLEVAEGTSIAGVLEQLGIASRTIHVVMLNGEMERDHERVLKDGDELVVFPPVAGG